MSTAAKVSIVIVGYNSVDWLTRCLDAVLGAGRPACDYEVVLVDNASRPPLAASLEDYRGRIKLVPMRRNVGFANACNVGRQLATGTHVLLLNPDAVVRPGAVDALLDHLSESPRRGLVGGRTLTPDGDTDPRSCWGQPSWWSQVCFATGLSTAFARTTVFDPESLGRWARDTEREVGVVTGCLLLTTTHVWDELGGFDPDFFMYGEDVDLSRRALSLGYRPSITPRAEAVHVWGASSSSAQKMIMVMKGKATLNRKQATAARRRMSAVLLLSGVALRAALEQATRGAGAWTTAWRRRDEWRAGWPQLDPGEAARADARFIAEVDRWELAS